MRALLVCDLADSTALIERLGDSAAAQLLREHDRVARELLQRHRGREIDKTDGFLALFERPIEALAFALGYQQALRILGEEAKQVLRARVGIHVGEVVLWENSAAAIGEGAKPLDVEGLAKPVAARLMALALPGQILLSGIAFSLAQRAERELDGAGNLRWLTHGRYRFKGVAAPMLVHEVGRPGLEPLHAPPSGPKAERDLPLWRKPAAIVVEVLAIVIAIAVPVALSLRAPPSIAFAERDWVVMAELRNITGEDRFDDALQSALRLGLEQSQYVNVLTELQVRDALQRMGLDPKATVLDRSLGAELAIREGARAVVLPTLSQVGGRIRFSVELVEPNSQTTVYAQSSDGEGEESILPSMDAVLERVRSDLGESIASIEKASGPLGKVTTTDMEALRAYSLAQQAVIDRRSEDALRLTLHAIARDPDFASAHLGLVNVYLTRGERAKALQHATLANRDPTRLSARERLMAQGALAMFGNPEEMIERWRLFALLYPDAATGQQVLAQVHWMFRNDAEAAEPYYLQVGESRDPRAGIAWSRLVEVRLARRDVEGSQQALTRAHSYPATRRLPGAMMVALLMGDHAAARAALQSDATPGSPDDEVQRALFRAAVAVDEGDLDDALAAVTPAVGTVTTGRWQRRARLVGVALGLARAPGELAALREWMTRAIASVPTEVGQAEHALLADLTMGALLATRHGEAAMAIKALDAIAVSVENSGYANLEHPYATVRCELLQTANAVIDCLTRLQEANPYYQSRVGLWKAQRRDGRDDDALASARWLVEHRGRAIAEWIDAYVSQVPNLLAAAEARDYLSANGKPPSPAEASNPRD